MTVRSRTKKLPAAKPKSEPRAACKGSRRERETETDVDIGLKIHRPISGICDEQDRVKGEKKPTEPKENANKEREKQKKKRKYPIPPPGYVFGVKPWLKRNEVWWEFGLSPRSLRRLEYRGILHPRILISHYLYERTEIDTAIRDARLLDLDGGAL